MEEKMFYGLSSAEVEERVNKGYTNHMNISVSKTKGEIIIEHTFTYFNFLNLFLAILIAITGQIKNMTFLGVIFFNTLIGIYQEFKVKKLIDKISVMTVSQTTVIRDGIRKEVSVDEIVKDDVILLESGQQICCDCRILEAHGFEVNESMITGESRPIKHIEGEELYSGSYVVEGSCIAQVLRVGEDNYAAALAKKARIKKRASSQMQEVIKKIIKVDAILLIPIGIALFLTQLSIAGNTRNDAIVGMVAGVIGMIPEGLVLLTSISFVLGVGRLAKKRALVQEMEAIEALARVDVLCLDKTGTITTGRLEVTEVVPLADTDLSKIEYVLGEIAWASEDVNATQSALRARFERVAKWKLTDEIPFSSERKFRAAAFEEKGSYILGAPEFITNKDSDIFKKVNSYAQNGFRVLFLGECSFDSTEKTYTDVKPLGLIVISDQIRSEAAATFAFFKEADVAIKIISGDHPHTVASIAKKAGLAGAEKYVDASSLPEDPIELREAVERYTIFGRVKPEQKQGIIKAFQENKRCVGMVGDGVNDVLALKDADCGIAMAAGSDAAKQVAHIVLLDSNFASMKNIVAEGKTIISNIERVSALYLTKTIYSILLCVIYIFLQREYPFIPIQLAWIGGIAIGVPSFLLALEQNHNRVSKGFLKQVLQISLPGALTLVLMIILTAILLPFLLEDGTYKPLFYLVVGGTASLIVVYRVCMPMTNYHRALCTILTIVFFGGILIGPGILGIHPINSRQAWLLLPLLSLVIICNIVLTRLMSVFTGVSERTNAENS